MYYAMSSFPLFPYVDHCNDTLTRHTLVEGDHYSHFPGPSEQVALLRHVPDSDTRMQHVQTDGRILVARCTPDMNAEIKRSAKCRHRSHRVSTCYLT